MSRFTGKVITVSIMVLLAAVLYAVVLFAPASLVYILGAFSVPGFIACGYALYIWVMMPDASSRIVLPKSMRKEVRK